MASIGRLSPLGRIIDGGASSDVYRLGASAVAKVFRPETDMTSVEREIACLDAVVEAGIDTPRRAGPLARTADGRLAIALEPARGEWNARSRLYRAPWAARRLMLDMAACLRAIHATEAPTGLPRMADRSAERVMQSSSFTLGQRKRTLQLLVDLTAREPGRALCHGNFQLGNVMWRRDACQAISWGNASAGVPLSDLARALVVLRFRKARFAGRWSNRLLARALAAGYLGTAPHAVTRERLRHWVLVEAVGRSGERISASQRQALHRFVTARLAALGPEDGRQVAIDG